MITPDDQAFPCNKDGKTEHGLTLRQWYKGQALAGLVVANTGKMVDDEEKVRIASALADAAVAEDQEHERRVANEQRDRE